MIAPALAIEPPTPQENAFQFVDISRSNRGVQKFQARYESPLKTSINRHDPRGSFHSSPSATFISSPNASPAAFRDSPFSSQSLYNDNRPAAYSKTIGLPIARSNVKSYPDVTSSGRKVSRHHRDLSGTSSTTSSLSGPPYDFCTAIDPSALQPPLRKLETETNPAQNEVNHIISPFINQVLEHGPDGTMTGRYSRPLTSTGRPSHARKTPPGHVKRPRNAFILFRSHACSSNLIPPAVEKDHRQISRIVSHMWKSLPTDEKMKWEREAEAEKELHRKLHPDYRYKPIYRKENAGKKVQGGPNSSSIKKKCIGQKKQKSANSNNTERLPKDSENCASVGKKSPDQLLQERDEEIRCEAVAKVLMETKLTGIKLDEGEMEERVLEQVRLVKENDAIHSQIKSQSMADSQSNEARPDSQTEHARSVNEKPKNKILAPLQARRKSLLNRSNSAPPPPSPLRAMHGREVVYNPKARGSRELSPDFPKPRLMMADEDMNVDDISYPPEDVSHDILFPGGFRSQLLSEPNYNPFSVLTTRNLSHHQYHSNSTPSQELEQLFHSPDFTFSDENCFRSQHNDVSNGFFSSQLREQDDYPIFNGLYGESKSVYHKGTPDQRHWESFAYQDSHYSSENYDPLTKLTEHSKGTLFFEESNSNVEEKRIVNPVSGEKENKGENGTGDDFLKDLTNFSNARRPSISEFTSTGRRKSSITMALSEISSPQLIEAIEVAKKNMAVCCDQTCKSLDEPVNRRNSVILSGLGEFPIMDFSLGLADPNQQAAIDKMKMECTQNQETFLQTGSQVSEKGPFTDFVHPFAASPANYRSSSTINSARSLINDDVAPDNYEANASHQYETMARGHVTKEPQVSDESRISLPGITFESGIGQDGQTYLFLTKEQAETEGLIAQILDAGFGVTYETDIPQEES